MNGLPRIVVVGAGIAGLCAAERLRELGFDGEIVIVGSESTMPVHRPMLSKQFLTGELAAADVLTAPAENLDATWRLNTPVSQLDPRRRVVHLPGGEELEYDGLVIASGVEPRRHPGGMNAHPRVVVVRTRADTRKMKNLLDRSREQVVVVGSGFIGCEVASSLRSMDRSVAIVGRTGTLMNNLLDNDLATRLTDLHRRNKVRLELGVTVRSWAGGASRAELLLSTGRTLGASCVVVAVGSVPAVSWLRDSGARLDNGVVCEATCHVEGMEDVVAAGDVASWPNLRFDGKPRRVEHWTNAIEMGRAAAESLLSGRESATPFTPVPRFWSEQHGLRIQAVGMPSVGVEHVSLDQVSTSQRSLTGYLRDGRLTGVIGFDRSVAVLDYGKKLRDASWPDTGTTGDRQPPAQPLSHV
ncbi:FAD-dependent oxidoreductase [Saccharothrix sp. 6-C]|uniref:NAD(P)/FAD-dependent oxidoreductase n=1 Tax=Saccharothrix sp. 6-C TaxID=2781735 RepID=UPI00191745AA|nr:FAD-dependent oxidoreductase [Saccharothrix sp. 6-C]QQQ74071.1 FAD-dependent oxidoreductase [Saccharothrix sp. 6-C]